MSGRQRQTTAQEVVAQGAIDDAMNGRIPRLGSYTVRFASGSFRTTVPKMFCENLGFENGDIAGVYADFDQGLLVYDLQEGPEYDPEVTHGGE
mgnify:CR=1 FL=1